jgi:hypothetical protein
MPPFSQLDLYPAVLSWAWSSQAQPANLFGSGPLQKRRASSSTAKRFIEVALPTLEV